jgi:predicted dehydrogenase
MVVGCGGMGRNQAGILDRMPEFELVAVCDINEENVQRAAEATGATPYTDFAEALQKEQPELVAVPSSNASHAPLTIQAAGCPSVRGVYTEKPMAVSMGEARAMVEACEQAGVKLVINHQRRIGPDMVEARKLIEQGAIGQVRRVRVQNAGDILSDGTHAVDSALHLLGDPDVDWVFGALHREIDEAMIERAERQRAKGKTSKPGYRYGHPVENGGMAIVQVNDEGGPRIELFCGDMREDFRIYQDYEVFGDAGRIWRTGDKHEPNLFIQDAEGGTWGAGLDEWTLKPVEGEGPGGWRPVPVEGRRAVHGIERGLRKMALWIHEDRPHEMCARNALRGFEIIMSVYESARTGKKIEMPLQQDEFPLQLMVDALA